MARSHARTSRRKFLPAKIITFDADLPLEPGDHFLRSLPSGLVEDYVVEDPNFMTGIRGIPSSFQSKVHRSRQAAASPQQVIQHITNHFNGDNSRVTFGTDNSVNVVNQLSAVGGCQPRRANQAARGLTTGAASAPRSRRL